MNAVSSVASVRPIVSRFRRISIAMLVSVLAVLQHLLPFETGSPETLRGHTLKAGVLEISRPNDLGDIAKLG